MPYQGFHYIELDRKVDNIKDALETSILLEEYDRNYRMSLDGFVTKEYTATDAWAHTEPDRKIICILPEELRDYNLPIEKHEILHNVFPEAQESFIYRAAFNPSYDIEARRFRIVYH